MQRREFVAASAAVALTPALARGAADGPGAGRERSNGTTTGGAGPADVPQQAEPTLTPAVYAERRARAQLELERRGLNLLIATPGTNFQYLAGGNPGRSERLIALLLPRSGDPVIVAPGFEVERVRRTTTVADVRGWEEQDDPFALAARIATGLARSGRAALEPGTEYGTALRFVEALPRLRIVNGAPVFEHLRIIKQPVELGLIRRAIEITQDAITATFAQLQAGMTERDVSGVVSREMAQRGGRGGGLVQFGPNAALPHGSPQMRRLEEGQPVLMDCGTSVEGYTSDITRTQWFGGEPPARFKAVYNTLHAAQTAAMTLGRPGVPCQEMDRAARRVIRDAGFGEYFTHRLGHGMGMEGHEAPYLVEGNAVQLEAGMVTTIEPGIYIPEVWGCRTEDDIVVTSSGVEVLSRRVTTI
jgi:Xaa-Pro dipeptidase